MNKFLIIGGARTGTTALSYCLREVACLTDSSISNPVIDEPLNHPTDGPRLYENNGYTMMRCFEDAKLLHKFVVNKGPGSKIVNRLTAGELYRILDRLYEKYIGIKHLYNNVLDLNNKIMFDYAIDNDIKILFLDRENYFDTTLSNMMAKQSGLWHVLTDENKAKQKQLKYDSIDICEFKKLYDHTRRRSRSISHYLTAKEFEHYRITYENFLGLNMTLEDRVQAFKVILSYIGWKYIESDKILKALEPTGKQNTEKYINSIPNIKELYELRDDYNGKK